VKGEPVANFRSILLLMARSRYERENWGKKEEKGGESVLPTCLSLSSTSRRKQKMVKSGNQGKKRGRGETVFPSSAMLFFYCRKIRKRGRERSVVKNPPQRRGGGGNAGEMRGKKGRKGKKGRGRGGISFFCRPPLPLRPERDKRKEGVNREGKRLTLQLGAFLPTSRNYY